MEIREIRDLGQQIRQRRRAAGLTADKTAALAGVSRRLLLELEQGKRPNVGFSSVLRILSFLGLRMEVQPRGLPGANGSSD
jgi:transcriptional regulator with XRE-family HTH domain